MTISAERLQNIEDRVQALSQMVRTLQAQGVQHSADPATSNPLSPDISSGITHEPNLGTPLTGHLARRRDGAVRYVDPSFWASMCHEAAELDDLLLKSSESLDRADRGESSSDDDDYIRGENSSELGEEDAEVERRRAVPTAGTTAVRPTESDLLPLFGENVQDAPSFATERRARRRTRRASLFQELPPKSTCSALIDSYVRGYHAIFPLVHVPSFRQRFEEFWRSQEDSDPGSLASEPFLALLVAICYAGSVASPDVFIGSSPNPEEVSRNLQTLGFKALRLARFPKAPTLDTFTAYMVLQATWMKEEDPLVCDSEISLQAVLPY